MIQNVTWIKKGRGVLFGRDGDAFHILHDYEDSGDGFTGSVHLVTTNAREAIMNYSSAIADRIAKELLVQMEKEGYDRNTGEKSKTIGDM